MKKDIDVILKNILSSIGMDVPSNYDSILDFVHNDVIETADNENWHSGDVVIAFRRFIEKCK